MILAGGLATRMGGQDKGLIPLAGRPMISWVIEAIDSQADAVIINANRNIEAYEALGYPVITDHVTGAAGPLAGIAAGLIGCRSEWLVTMPCDTPRVPAVLIQRLADGINGAEAAVAHDGQRLQPAHAMLRASAADRLETFLARGGRRMHDWYAAIDTATVDFSNHRDAFDNVNTPEQHARMEARLLGWQKEAR
ncbi:molybdenum cofactor guanylyltransferase MobA [Spiribacter vilamensis]|nr:molybdenum cofactor guanylyltransferase MobA [Spiribacter vilamensis]